ncbi:MAG: DUF2793 domain-containing protein [Pseudomonadota bacterium]
MEQSPRLSLSYLAPSQAQKHVTVNESFRRLDQLIQMTVKSRIVSAQPASPADGDAYLLPASPTGADWSGFSQHSVAAFQDDVWIEFAPSTGLRLWDESDGAWLVFDGVSWGGPERLGVNASPDAANRFVARSNAVLFDSIDTGEGGDGDCQVKINKEATADNASLLFQTGFSGRAEFGLAGDDDFHIKVSPNGSSWIDALRFDKDDAKAIFGGTVDFNGNELILDANGDTSIRADTDDNFKIKISGTDRLLIGGAGLVTLNTSAANNAITQLLAGHSSNDRGFRIINRHNGGARTTALSNNLDYDGTTYTQGNWGGSSYIWFNGGSVIIYNDEQVSPGSQDAIAPTESFRIDENNNVGIGENTPSSKLHIDGGGVQCGNPTGGDKGTGAINAEAIYDDNTLLSCYVFDQALDGAIDEAKWDNRVPDRVVPRETEKTARVVDVVRDEKTGDIIDEILAFEEKIIAEQRTIPRRHEPMRAFRARAGTANDPLTLDGYAKHWREKRHLSSMPNEATYDPKKGLTTGEWIQRLVETVEIQAVLIERLNARTKASANPRKR